MITRASGAPLRVGWKVRAAPLAYTHALARGGAPEYVVRRRRRLLELAGIPVSDSLPRITLATHERLQGEADLRSAGAPRRAIALHSRSSRAARRAIGRSSDSPRSRNALLDRGITPIVLMAGTPNAVVGRMRALCPRAILVPALDGNRDRGDAPLSRRARRVRRPRFRRHGPGAHGRRARRAARDALRSNDARELRAGARDDHRASYARSGGRIRDENRMHRAGHDFFSGVTVDMVMDAILGSSRTRPRARSSGQSHAG